MGTSGRAHERVNCDRNGRFLSQFGRRQCQSSTSPRSDRLPHWSVSREPARRTASCATGALSPSDHCGKRNRPGICSTSSRSPALCDLASVMLNALAVQPLVDLADALTAGWIRTQSKY